MPYRATKPTNPAKALARHDGANLKTMPLRAIGGRGLFRGFSIKALSNTLLTLPSAEESAAPRCPQGIINPRDKKRVDARNGLHPPQRYFVRSILINLCRAAVVIAHNSYPLVATVNLASAKVISSNFLTHSTRRNNLVNAVL